MKILILLFIILPSLSAVAQNATLQDSSYLKKLSMHVRGYPPSPQEYSDLKAAQTNSSTAAFFDKKISEYLASDEHAAKLSVRLEELFKLKTAPTVPGLPSSIIDPSGFVENALNDLFLSIGKQNLSWDQLLTSKKYTLTSGRVWGGIDDFDFMRAVITDLPSSDVVGPTDVNTIKKVDHEFAADDNRIAGALTTARFFNRYNTTEMNKNRKRAAAVFSIFLCDSMSPAIPAPPSSPDGLLQKAFPTATATPAPTPSPTENDLKNELKANDRHGSDQACMQCHYKLDPVGKVFMNSNRGLSPTASMGRLTYKEPKTGELIDVPVNGAGELGAAIAKQDQYARCQVRTFWNWFIGTDRTLSEDREKELISKFNEVGRRANDFIAIMLKAPEFRTRSFQTEAQIRVTAVKQVLNNCTQCHATEGVPDFTQWPIGGTKENMQKWSVRIAHQLDFDNDGANRKMPPKESMWQPTADQLQLLKLWFKDGAPDENGSSQL